MDPQTLDTVSDLVTKCSVCQALIDEEDLFCANCGTEAPQDDASASQQAGSSHVATHSFQCQGCGASMSYDASARSLRCPFCGSDKLDKTTSERVLSANRVVEFEIHKESASAKLRSWLGKGFWRPGDLSRRAEVDKMTPVYVPYWVFRAKTHTYWTADTNQLPFGSRGDWRPLSGKHRGKYEGLLVGASGALTSAETSALCPFRLEDAVSADQVDLQNVTVEQFKVGRKYARPLARQGLENLEANACQVQYVPGRARNVQVNVRIEDMSSEPVLLPVWIMAYRYKQKVYRFLINGQSGTATGEAPTSLLKIAVACGIGFALLAALAMLIAILSN